jgi:hypothetical protein
MELTEDQVEEIRNKYRFKAGARVWEQGGDYFVFFSSVFYLDRKLTRKEIHCFWYDDEDGNYYSFIPLVKIINQEGINEINLLLENLSTEDGSESYQVSSSSESEEDEIEALLDGTFLDDEEEDEIEINEQEEKIKFDPKYFDIEEEVKAILLLESQGFPKGDWQVGFKHYQIERIVLREARYKEAYAFFVVKNGKQILYSTGWPKSREQLESMLRDRDYYSFFGSKSSSERDWKKKNVEDGITRKRILSLVHL